MIYSGPQLANQQMKSTDAEAVASRYMGILNSSPQLSAERRAKSNSLLEVRGTTSFSQARTSLLTETRKDIRKKVIALIRRRFKNPYNAFCQMDYDGKGLILKENFYLALPDLTQHVSEEQVEDFFKAERIFQAPPYHTLDLAHFMRIFFPSVRAEDDYNQLEDLTERSPKSMAALSDTGLRRTPLQERLENVEKLLKEKLHMNYRSARKAFLELDANYDGYVEAKDLAARLMNTASLAEGDLKMLFKLKSTRKDGKLSFQDFIAWFGVVIEPPSDFYFRHDQHRTHHEKGSRLGEWKGARDITTLAFEKKLRQVIHSQWKSVKKAFMDLNRTHAHYIEPDELQQFMLVRCGFKMSEEEFRAFFERIDKDGDGRLSYQDFNDFFGFDINPAEDLFFRQQAAIPKRETAEIIRKWEFNTSNLNQGQLKQNQKINHGHVVLESAAAKMGEQEWRQLLKKLRSQDKLRDYTVDVEVFFELWNKATGSPLQVWDRECVHQALMSTADSTRINISQLISLKAKADLDSKARKLKHSGSAPTLQAAEDREALYREVLEVLSNKGLSEAELLLFVDSALQGRKREESEEGEILLREAIGEFAPELGVEKYRNLVPYLVEKHFLHRALHQKQKNSAPTQQDLSEILSSTTVGRGRNKSMSIPPLNRPAGSSFHAEHSTIDIPAREGNEDISEDLGSFEAKIRSSKSFGNLQGAPPGLQHSLSMTASSFLNPMSMERRFRLLKTKLEYEWPSIYRTLVSRDLDQKERVSLSDLKGALLRCGIYLDKENWKTVQRYFTEEASVLYKEMGLQLGLHRAGLESISSTRLQNFLKKMPHLRKSLHRDASAPLEPLMEKAASVKTLRVPAKLEVLEKKKGTLKRLFRNFDQCNNSVVSQQEFLNITSKLGAKLSMKDIAAFEQEAPERRLKLSDSTKQINYRKFLERLEHQRNKN